MITLVFCLRRLPHFSREAFQERWLGHHGAMVAERAMVLRIERYVQSHAFDEKRLGGVASIRSAPEPYDGVAQVSWNTIDDLMATFNDPQASVAALELLEDERLFIDLERSPIFFTREHVLVSPRGQAQLGERL